MSARSACILVIVLVALAAALRMHGIGFGVPVWPEPDVFIVDHVTYVRNGSAGHDRMLSGSQYPSLLADITLLLPGSERDPARLAEMQLSEHLRNAALPYLQVRMLVALLSLLVIPATYLVARHFLAPGWSVLAAALAACSLLLVNFAQTARPHAALTALTTLAIAAALRLRRQPTPTNHLLAGLAATLAIGCLHTGALTLLAVAAALALPYARERRWRGGLTLLPLCMPLAAMLWFYRGIYDFAEVHAHVNGMTAVDQEPITFAWWIEELWRNLDGVGVLRVARILSSWEPVLGVLALCAAGLGLVQLLRGRSPDRERLADLWVVAAFALPYGLLLAAFGKTYERFLTPLIPLLACAGAWLWSRAWTNAGRARGLVLAASLASLLVSSLAGVKLAALRARPDTLQEAAALIRARARPGEAVILAPPIDLALARTPATLARTPELQPALFSPWALYQARLPADGIRGEQHDLVWFGEHAGMGDLDCDTDLAAYVDHYGPGLYVIELERQRKHRWYARIRERVAQVGRLEARLSPDGDPFLTELGLGVQEREFADRPHAAWRILCARSTGPVLEIYRVEP